MQNWIKLESKCLFYFSCTPSTSLSTGDIKMNRSFPSYAAHSLIGNEICKQRISVQYVKNYNKIILRNSKLNQGMISRESDAEPSFNKVKMRKQGVISKENRVNKDSNL